MRFLVVAILLSAFNMVSWADGVKDFYVNSFSCHDEADGSMVFPYKSLADLSQVEIGPGDRIHLAGDQVHHGSIILRGVKSAPDCPLIITSYGHGVAQIHSGDSVAIKIEGCDNVMVNRLSLHGSGRKGGNHSNGLTLLNSHHVTVDSVEAVGYHFNGICCNEGGDISITRCHVHDNGYNGIEITGREGAKSVHNVYIAHCIAQNNAGCPSILTNHSGSGILVGHATNALVEYCESMCNGWDMPRPGNGPVGIWGYEADSLTIRYCYSHDNKTSPTGLDGGGFDLDGGITNSVLEYNLSMNNEGAGYGLFQYGGATEWSGNVMRHNVSINDGIKNSNAGIYVWCDPYNKNIPLCDTRVHDNLIVSNRGYSVSFSTGYARQLVFENNTFILAANGSEHLHGDETVSLSRFRGNRFWSEEATTKGEPQPRVAHDPAAIYAPHAYTIPANVDVRRVKEIISQLLSQEFANR